MKQVYAVSPLTLANSLLSFVYKEGSKRFPTENHKRDKETKMKIDFTGASEIVRSEILFKKGQKIVTENGEKVSFVGAAKVGNVRWFTFRDEDGRLFFFRMMAFPYMHAMGEKISIRDNIGPIDVRVSILKNINRRIANLLK